MKVKQTTITGKFLGTLAILILTAALLIGCQAQAQTSAPAAQTAAHTASTASAIATTPAAQTTAAAAASTAAASSTVAEAKTLKIGVNIWTGWAPGIDGLHGYQVLTDMVNSQGGLKIGNDTYQIELVVYDNNNVQSTAVAAINKLIFEDKIQFILGDAVWTDAYFNITEANKVILVSSPHTQTILEPDKKYCFDGAYTNSQIPAVNGWFFNQYPDVKYIVHAAPDSVDGHGGQSNFEAAYKAFGEKYDWVFYPPNSSDLSAVATKIMSLNPDCFTTMEGGSTSAALCFKALYQAGYKGMLFYPGSGSGQMLGVAPAEALEGLIVSAHSVEFENPPTELAREFRAAWINKFGSWENPEVAFVSQLSCLLAGLQKAGTLDTDKVSDAISDGLEFESPSGPSKMFDRPDLGNDRTIDSAVGTNIGKITGGKLVYLDSISLENAIKYSRQVFGTTLNQNQ